MIAVFHKVFLDQLTFSQQPTEQSPFLPDTVGGTASMNAVDLVAELVSGKNTCQELGKQALSFFKMVQRALKEPPLSTEAGVDADSNGDRNARSPTSTASQESRPPVRLHHHPGPPRTPHPLKLDGILLKHAIWIAAVVDSERFSLDIFFVFLFAGAIFVCVGISLCVWGRWGRRGRARRELKEAGGGKLFRRPQKVSASGKRDKME
ncbi:unnamed protein product [Hapterophycus canaliculatus]